MSECGDHIIPETRVLAIASHVVYGYVGNTMAGFVMQALGCEVAAINTVNFSNHTGYGQVRGTKATATEISDLYSGLTSSGLSDFDMLLTGYIPGREAVASVGSIARSLKSSSSTTPGSFFWVLDPVMGDNGKLYVAEDVVPMYRELITDADLIVPNQYEAEWLSGVTISDMPSLVRAVDVLHGRFGVPHVVITSVSFPGKDGVVPGEIDGEEKNLSVLGSTRRSDGSSRIFRVRVPSLDCFFSGTGDMFAALMVVRLREAVSREPSLSQVASWVSDDEVTPTDLPLAKAVVKALESMQEVLTRTMVARDKELADWEAKRIREGLDEESEKQKHLRRTKAAEVRLVRNLDCLKHPKTVLEAEVLEVDI